VVPLDTGRDNELVRFPPQSSFFEMSDSADTDDPVNTPRTVSKELPTVFIASVPEDAGVNEYHFVDPVEPNVMGSFVSRVAPEFESEILPLAPERTRAAEKKSLLPTSERVTEFENAENEEAPADELADTLNW
jgi:hypothetical protein